MAKKNIYKNVKVNEEELAITTIDEIENTEQSNVLIFVLFGIILLFIFCLPWIANLIKGSKEKPDYSIIENKKEKEDKPVVKEPDHFYTISDSLTVPLEDKINIHHFKISDNTIVFQVSNNGEGRFDFSKDNYFLELYSEDTMLLERISLSDIEVSKTDGNKEYTFSLKDNIASNVNKLLFVKKSINDYPNVILEKNDQGEEILVCTNEVEEITYQFQNGKLIKLGEVLHFENTEPDYNNFLNEWQNKSNTLNNIDGITSVFVSTDTGFVVNTSIDVKVVKQTTALEGIRYYPSDTLAKVVKFEMEAKGFICK